MDILLKGCDVLMMTLDICIVLSHNFTGIFLVVDIFSIEWYFKTTAFQLLKCFVDSMQW